MCTQRFIYKYIWTWRSKWWLEFIESFSLINKFHSKLFGSFFFLSFHGHWNVEFSSIKCAISEKKNRCTEQLFKDSPNHRMFGSIDRCWKNDKNYNWFSQKYLLMINFTVKYVCPTIWLDKYVRLQWMTKNNCNLIGSMKFSMQNWKIGDDKSINPSPRIFSSFPSFQFDEFNLLNIQVTLQRENVDWSSIR